MADLLGYDTGAAFISNLCPLRNTAQMMRANLAASATTTVFTCAQALRDLSALAPVSRSHAARGCQRTLPQECRAR